MDEFMMHLPHPYSVDIVVSSNLSGNDLQFLRHWTEILKAYHFLVVQIDGVESNSTVRNQAALTTGNQSVDVLNNFNHEIITRDQVKAILGPRIACISSDYSACRSIGWLFSKKRYIFTITNDCIPVKSPYTNLTVNPLKEHVNNLEMPSTPFYLNTLYDPYRPSCDFVRGYPFSLRAGVPTAISHGLWLNDPDYDAPTQLVRPNERNSRYVNAVLTIPKGSLFSMSAMNLAFDRELIGASMYFPPIGECQLAFGGDIWAGLCAKTICDHLGLGVKNGLPYVWRNKTSNPFASMRKEYKSILWQEEIVPFFQSVKFSSKADSAEKCYLEIAKQVKEKLSRIDPFFSRLADLMIMWIEVWIEQTLVTPDTSIAGD